MHIEVAEEYAEEHFFERLDQVAEGQTFAITIEGRPGAQMRPPADPALQNACELTHPATEVPLDGEYSARFGENGQ
jgi:antitoxin (DNA-binding transcriptional repressor) of toxin-antitoxin stability system